MITMWWVSLIFLSLFAFCAVINLVIAINNYLLGKKWVSMVPLVGGVAGVVGCLTFPSGKLFFYWWVPLLLDYGSIPITAHTLVFILTHYLRPSGTREKR